MDSILLAKISFLAERRASACAFPLPSAIASAKLANKTVNQSKIEINNIKDGELSFIPNSEKIYKTVVNIEAIYTINITGFCN